MNFGSSYGFRWLLGSSLLLAGLAGCTLLSDPYRDADRLAAEAGLVRQVVATQKFDLISYRRSGAPGAPVTIYLEGDGAAWRSRYRPAHDPTPREPLALELAGRDPAVNLVYLARPCQYVIEAERDRGCAMGYWAKRRLSREVVAATRQAVDLIKSATGADGIHLVGYSGGGGLAVLVAAGRDDILTLRTVGGNLDHVAFTDYHRVTPMEGSLNPADVAAAVASVPQLHFIGGRDEVVPSQLAERFVARQGPAACSRIVTIADAGHVEGWRLRWPDLLTLPFPCPPVSPKRD